MNNIVNGNITKGLHREYCWDSAAHPKINHGKIKYDEDDEKNLKH